MPARKRAAGLFVEGNMLIRTFQYLLIAAGFSACMLFMFALAVTEPLT
jgi:hypothetical protein